MHARGTRCLRACSVSTCLRSSLPRAVTTWTYTQPFSLPRAPLLRGPLPHALCLSLVARAAQTTNVLFSIAFVLLLAVVTSQVLAKRLRKYKPVWWAQEGDETAAAVGPGGEMELTGIHPLQAAIVTGVKPPAALQQAFAVSSPAADAAPVYASAQARPIMEATFADVSKEHHDATPLVMGVKQRQEFHHGGVVMTISPLERRELRMSVLGTKGSTRAAIIDPSDHPSTHV